MMPITIIADKTFKEQKMPAKEKTEKVNLICAACNKRFKRTLTRFKQSLTNNIYAIKCPKCHEYDTGLDYSRL